MRSAQHHRPALLLAAAFAVAAVLVRALSTGVPEMGDGVQHYQIARHAWQHPVLLLDQWGKPLFTLLASPFARLGPLGLVVFNALVAWVACWCGVRLLPGTARVAGLVFVGLTWMAPAFWGMVLAGMTEVLFATLAIAAVWLLHRERWVMAALVASLTPIARPEYVAFLPMVALWLALQRRWVAVLLCATGLVVHGIATACAFGDPFWFWTHTSYGNGPSVYGSGPLLHFIQNAPSTFGWPLLIVFVAALLGWLPTQRRDTTHQRTHRLLLVTAAVPVLLALAVHSWVWWKGIHGSAGVTRVLATVVPLAALFAVHTGWRAVAVFVPSARRVKLLRGVALAACAAGTVTTLIATVPIPQGDGQRPLDGAGDRLCTLLHPGVQVFSTHPYAAFHARLDPYKEAEYRTVWSLQGRSVVDYFPPGALVYWDSQLGPNESALPLDSLFPSTHMVLEGIWHPAFGYHVVGDVPYAVYLFRRAENRWTHTVDTLMAPGIDRLKARPAGIATGDHFPAGVEYPWTVDLPAPTDDAVLEEWEIKANFRPEADDRMSIVFKRTEGGTTVRYEEETLRPGPIAFRWPVHAVEVAQEQLIYIWDGAQRPFTLSDVVLLRHRWHQQPLP